MDPETLEQVFAEIDRNGNGTLEPDELKALMARADLDVSGQELDEMIKMADVDGDGLIDLQEFKQLFLDFTV
jgi:calmodulin